MKNDAGNLNLFKNKRIDFNASNVLNALFYPIQTTGLTVYPYLNAYFINPFLCFR